MLPTAYQSFIHTTRYARWSAEKKRREDWDETIGRYLVFWKEQNLGITDKEILEIGSYVSNLQVMPSMRSLMTAGPALTRDHVAGYNCAYLSLSDVSSFAEMMYILMCGCGVGYSVERQYTNKLPELPSELSDSKTTIVVEDDRLSWAKSYQLLLNCLYLGEVPKWDLNQLRPAGLNLRPSEDGLQVLVRWKTSLNSLSASSVEQWMMIEDALRLLSAMTSPARLERLSLVEVSDAARLLAFLTSPTTE